MRGGSENDNRLFPTTSSYEKLACASFSTIGYSVEIRLYSSPLVVVVECCIVCNNILVFINT